METIQENEEHILFANFPVANEVKISIVIPVKDEEEHIHQTLEAFTLQTDLSGKLFSKNLFEILILANNCSDKSVMIIMDFQTDNPDLNIFLENITLEPCDAKIGFVRKSLMETAYRRLLQSNGGIIMTTDGDTQVSPDWISQTCAEIKAGADAVGGRILFFPNDLENMDSLTNSIFLKDQKYSLLVADLEAQIMDLPYNPAPAHHQHFNGSFAVTTEFYGKSGGVPDVSFLEDNAFFERLQMVDAKIKMSNKVVVYTSARYNGRAEVGLSYKLKVWNTLGEDGSHLMVECAKSLEDRFRLKKALLNIWQKRELSGFNLKNEISNLKAVFCDLNLLENAFHESQYFGEFYFRFEELQSKIWREKYSPTGIDSASRDLERILQNYSVADLSQTSIR